MKDEHIEIEKIIIQLIEQKKQENLWLDLFINRHYNKLQNKTKIQKLEKAENPEKE